MADNVSRVAETLYGSGCLKFGEFRIKSGASSPYYVDLASLLSSPPSLNGIADIAAGRIKEIGRSDRIDKLASIELKGALVLPSIACRLNLPAVVVRKDSKAYGVVGRTAGAEVKKGDQILFFDDVVSEGLSKIEGIKPLEELGGSVRHILVVVDREQGGRESLEQTGYHVHALARITDLALALFNDQRITSQQKATVLAYIQKKQ